MYLNMIVDASFLNCSHCTYRFKKSLPPVQGYPCPWFAGPYQWPWLEALKQQRKTRSVWMWVARCCFQPCFAFLGNVANPTVNHRCLTRNRKIGVRAVPIGGPSLGLPYETSPFVETWLYQKYTTAEVSCDFVLVCKVSLVLYLMLLLLLHGLPGFTSIVSAIWFCFFHLSLVERYGNILVETQKLAQEVFPH